MSTLYIRLPARNLTDGIAADGAPDWLALPCPYALVTLGGSLERQDTAPLSDLSGIIASAQRVVLLLAASDVTLLQVKVPPLSSAKLKAALPNLVEERLLSDPAECTVVAGSLANGLRTVAIVQRSWIVLLAKTLIAYGARRFAALPASMCLPYLSGQDGSTDQHTDRTGKIVAAINHQHNQQSLDLIVRLSEHSGIGLTIAANQPDAAAQEVIRTLCALAAEAPISLYVPQASLRNYQDAVNQSDALSGRISVLADNWSRWIGGARNCTLDLMAGISAASGSSLNWRAWRWPLALATLLLMVNAVALNFDWWRMKSEAATLRASMIQSYKSAYPKESVIIDPLAQMRQKIDIAKRNAGLPGANDFTALTAAFGAAWAKAGGKQPGIAALEYHANSLIVRLKPGVEAPTQRVQAALAEYNLSLEPVPEQSAITAWKIRSQK